MDRPERGRSTNYQPAGLPIQFGNLSADTLTDGYNFFAGARTYDPLISKWTSPDPGAGSRNDPLSQMPYIWNRSNPVTYQDPTGYCADPGGKGTRVCVDFLHPFMAVRIRRQPQLPELRQPR
jgi:RHS repeat-associated protein